MASTILTLSDIDSMESGDLRKFVSSARTAVKNAVKADRNATNRAAYATWIAEFRLGIIGKDNKSSESFMTDENWAASFEKVKSITGAWRTLGRVMVDLGLDPEGQTFTRLRNSNIYQTADCKKVIADCTPDNVEDRLVAFMEGKVDPFGKRITQRSSSDTESEAARKAKKEAAALDGAIGEFVASQAEKVGDVTAQALVLVTALRKTCAEMDHDEWAKVTEALQAFVTERTDAFAKDLKVAAKKAS